MESSTAEFLVAAIASAQLPTQKNTHINTYIQLARIASHMRDEPCFLPLRASLRRRRSQTDVRARQLGHPLLVHERRHQ